MGRRGSRHSAALRFMRHALRLRPPRLPLQFGAQGRAGASAPRWCGAGAGELLGVPRRLPSGLVLPCQSCAPQKTQGAWQEHTAPLMACLLSVDAGRAGLQQQTGTWTPAITGARPRPWTQQPCRGPRRGGSSVQVQFGPFCAGHSTLRTLQSHAVARSVVGLGLLAKSNTIVTLARHPRTKGDLGERGGHGRQRLGGRLLGWMRGRRGPSGPYRGRGTTYGGRQRTQAEAERVKRGRRRRARDTQEASQCARTTGELAVL